MIPHLVFCVGGWRELNCVSKLQQPTGSLTDRLPIFNLSWKAWSSSLWVNCSCSRFLSELLWSFGFNNFTIKLLKPNDPSPGFLWATCPTGDFLPHSSVSWRLPASLLSDLETSCLTPQWAGCSLLLGGGAGLGRLPGPGCTRCCLQAPRGLIPQAAAVRRPDGVHMYNLTFLRGNTTPPTDPQCHEHVHSCGGITRRGRLGSGCLFHARRRRRQQTAAARLFLTEPRGPSQIQVSRGQLPPVQRQSVTSGTRTPPGGAEVEGGGTKPTHTHTLTQTHTHTDHPTLDHRRPEIKPKYLGCERRVMFWGLVRVPLSTWRRYWSQPPGVRTLLIQLYIFGCNFGNLCESCILDAGEVTEFPVFERVTRGWRFGTAVN